MSNGYTFVYEDKVQELLFIAPWLASWFMRIPGVNVDGTDMEDAFPWMATDGKYSYYKQSAMSKETDVFGAFAIIHENVHVLLGHPFMKRSQQREVLDMQLWDYAIENVCNYWAGVFVGKVDPRVVYDPKWDGMTEYQIYDALLKDPEEQKKARQAMGGARDKIKASFSPSEGFPEDGSLPEHEMWGTATPEEVAKARQDAARALADISLGLERHGRGTQAGKVQLLVKSILDDTTWEDILMKYLEYTNTKDFTFAKLDRRTIPGGVLMPSLMDTRHDKNSLRRAKIFIDTSGSTTGRAQQRCMGSLKKIFEELGGYECNVIYIDAAVHKEIPLEQWDQHNFEGGGGTSFLPAFDYVKEKYDDDISVMMFFTDGEDGGEIRRMQQPPYDVLWVHFGNPNYQYPFGEKINYTV